MGLRIVLADDNQQMRAAVHDVLAQAGLDVIASLGDGAGALAAAIEHRPDVVVMDVEMTGGGPDLAQRLVALSPAPRVMVFSGRDDADTVLRMLAAGATGYVAKGVLGEDLAACVRRCAEGVFFVAADCADRVRARLSQTMSMV